MHNSEIYFFAKFILIDREGVLPSHCIISGDMEDQQREHQWLLSGGQRNALVRRELPLPNSNACFMSLQYA